MERQCVICSGPLIYAHLGVNACRACAVFYKRTATSTARLKCKRLTNDCMQLNPQSSCRKCRFTKIEEILKKAVGNSESINSEHEDVGDMPETSGDSKNFDNERLTSDRTLLERLTVQYRSMSHTRLIAEMHARGGTPHPLRLISGKPPAFPATVKSIQTGNQIFLSSALEFASAAFPGFDDLAEQERWDVITEFFYRLKTFEGCYRANELFPDISDRFLPNYTTYLGLEIYDNFAKDLPDNADRNGAWSYITNCKYMSSHVSAGRELLARVNPSHEEYLAVVGLMFWSIEDLPYRQDISTLSEKYTKKIMSELHSYYRQELKLEDYATRLGELLMFLQVFDVKDQFKEHVEMLRLLNVYTDDTFVYRLQKE